MTTEQLIRRAEREDRAAAGSLPAWVVQAWRDRGRCQRCGGAGDSTWAGTGDVLCWDCISRRQAEHDGRRQGR